MTTSTSQRLAAEAVGTGVLVTAVVGSGIMAAKLAGGNAAVALLCNTIPTGAILFVLITMFGPISGAHFNPAVSIVMAQCGELDRGLVRPYVLAQIAGGCIGAVVAHGMFGLDLLQLSSTVRGGSAQLFAEFIATAGLLLTIIGVVRVRPEAVATAVALYITSAYWFTASTSFANPAVTIARSISDTYAGIAPSSVPMFILAQAAGATVGALAGQWLFAKR